MASYGRNKVIFWDFDGTLAHRNGFFSEVLLEILNEYEQNHDYKIDDIRLFLKDGFPWHKPENPHFELNDAKAWWNLNSKSHADCLWLCINTPKCSFTLQYGIINLENI